MVTFRVRGVPIHSLDSPRFNALLRRAEGAGGRDEFPVLFSLPVGDPEVHPDVLVDELQRLAIAIRGAPEAPLVGTLRDDLLQGLAVAEEG